MSPARCCRSPAGAELDRSWPALDALLPALGFVPSRTGSVITTIYGDAILPRGGALALADLLVLMRRLGATEGVVRTAVSRLSRDGVLAGRRLGRISTYALTQPSRAEFTAAIPAIYGPLDREWDGVPHLAFPDDPAQRTLLEAQGFAALAQGVLLGADPPPPGVTTLRATGSEADIRSLAARAWPTPMLDAQYMKFIEDFGPLAATAPPGPLDAMAARIILLHAYRRLALRTPSLPAAFRPADWAGTAARTCCECLYRTWSPAAEAWLDQASDGSGPLPRGPDPSARFSGGDRRPSGPAWSPARSGSPRRAPAAPR